MKITIRQKELKDGSRSLYLDIYHNGKRRYEFLKDLPYLTGNSKQDKEILKLAENIKATRQLEIANNSHGFIPTFTKKKNFLKYFQQIADTLTKSTKNQYECVILKVKEYKGDQITFSDIDKNWINGFKDHLQKSLKQNTARTYFAIFKAVLNRAVKKEIINKNPADAVDNFKKTKDRISYLEVAEMKALKDTPMDRWDLKDAFFFSCYTGLRYSDVKKLRWDQIRAGRIEFRQQKTGDVEYIPLSDQAEEILKRMNKNRPKVFKLAANSGVNIAMKKWAEDAGLKRWEKIVNEDGTTIQRGLTYHVSRHTFAVQLLSNGVDVFTLQKLMGHGSIDSTMVYADIVSGTKEKAINKFPEI